MGFVRAVGFIEPTRLVCMTGPHGIPDPQPPPCFSPGSFRDIQLHPLKGKPFRLLGEIPPSHHTSLKMSSGESRKFTCSACGKHYQQSSHLRRHERTRMLSTLFLFISGSLTIATDAEKNTERIPCKYCEQSFMKRYVTPCHQEHKKNQVKGKKGCAIRDSNSSSCLVPEIVVGKQSPDH